MIVKKFSALFLNIFGFLNHITNNSPADYQIIKNIC